MKPPIFSVGPWICVDAFWLEKLVFASSYFLFQMVACSDISLCLHIPDGCFFDILIFHVVKGIILSCVTPSLLPYLPEHKPHISPECALSKFGHGL
jgi:hypothetical protein